MPRPLRIAFLTTDDRDLFPIAEASRPRFGAAPEAVLQGFALIDDLEVHVVSCTRQSRPAPPKLADNIFFHSLVVPRWGRLRTAYLGRIQAVRRALRILEPDLVHGQGTERDCAISAVWSGHPNVLTIHGNMAELYRLFPQDLGSFGWCTARLENFCLRRTSGVFCNSGYTEALVAPRTRRTWRVANPIRPEFFAPARLAPPPGCTIVNVGTISARKRQLELLAVARQLHAAGHSCEWLFIGPLSAESAYAREFLAQAGRAEREGYARYVGPLDLAALIECYDSARAMVHFPTEEAFGLVVPEALARNLKFFGARVGGITDIADGLPGVELFDPADSAALIDGIAAWIRLGAPRPTTAANIIQQRYHPRVIAERHREIYREVLGGTHSQTTS